MDDTDLLLDKVLVSIREREIPAFPQPRVAIPLKGSLRPEVVPAPPRGIQGRRKMIMRFTGFGAAAAVLVLMSVVFVSATGRVSLAEVVQAVREHSFCRYSWIELNKNTDGLGPDIDDVTTKRTVYVDLKRDRFRTEMETEYNGAPYTFLVLEDLVSGEQLMINPQQRKATLILRPKNESPLRLLQRLEKMQHKAATEHFEDELNGHKVLGYRLVDAAKQETVTIWVDPSTRLPVKITQDMPKFKIWYTMTGFDWDPEMGAVDKLFAFDIPEGYEKTIINEREAATK